MKSLRLTIILTLFFGGGLAISLGHLLFAAGLFASGLVLYFVWNKRKMLPE